MASKEKLAADLERRAASNIATADAMENLGPFSAEPSYTQPLRDRAAEMQAMAARLRQPKRKRGNAAPS